jgi:hypothetical protein
MFMFVIVNVNTLELFNPNVLELNVGQSINWNVGVQHVFKTIQTTPSLFKTLTNFNQLKFDELVSVVASTNM